MGRVIISYYGDTGKKYKSDRWMHWWNGNKDREDIIKAKRARDRIYYNRHKDNILKKRRDTYNSSV